MTTRAFELRYKNGDVWRFGPDERDPGDVPSSISHGTQLPGGYGPGFVTLPRPPAMEADDAKLFAEGITYEAETGRPFHEGRVTGIPQVGPSQVEIQLEGWSNATNDNKASARMIFYDKDLGAWQGMSVQDKFNLLIAGFFKNLGDASVVPDSSTGEPALECGVDNPWTDLPVVEGWYDSEGIGIQSLDYAWKIGDTIFPTDSTWQWLAGLSTDDFNSSSDDTGNLRAAGPGYGTLNATALRKYAFVRLINTLGGGPFTGSVDGRHYSLMWTLLGIVGPHTVPIQGSVAAPNQGRGVLVSDVLAYIIGRWCPALNYTTGPYGSIEPTSYVVPHLKFTDAGAPSAMIDPITLFGGNSFLPLDWGCYDNREFFAKTPGNYGSVWYLRSDQGSEPTSAGADAQGRLNGVQVAYDEDGSGTKRTVGPPGSGADTETSVLADASFENPANHDGQPHWDSIDVGITDLGGALILGQATLLNANRKTWRGTVSAKHEVQDAAGNWHPVDAIKAGDRAILSGGDGSELPIESTSWDGPSRSSEVTVGAAPDRIPTLLARLSEALTGRLSA
jgi:hypothetical protein